MIALPGRGIVVVVAWGVLSFGAVYPWAYWPLYLLSGALGLWGVVGLSAWNDERLVRIAWACGALIVCLGLQVIAWPGWIVSALSPGVDLFWRQYAVGYQSPGFATLSIAPDATRRVIVEVLAFSLLFLGAARLMREISLDWLVGQLMGLAVAVACIGIVQKVLLDVNDPLLYGFWRPRDGGNPFGPFVNRNHFAGWMVMVLPVVAAYAWALVHRADRPGVAGGAVWARWTGSVEGNRALLALSSVVILGTSLVLTGSRSGMASFAIALLVLAIFVLHRLHGRHRWIAAGYLAAVFVAAFTWAGAEAAVARFERAPAEIEGRLTAWRDTHRLIRDFPVFGTGLGGFGRAMLVYQTADRHATYAQAHNDYLQLVAEGGALGGGAAAVVAVLIGLAIRRRLRAGDTNRVTYWVRRGAVAGLVGIAAQSLVEFSLQMPGNAVLCVVLAALAVHRPRPGSHAHRV